MIDYDQFIAVELKVGTVVEASEIEGSEKLLKLSVDLGEEAPRQILSGIKQWYKPEQLMGKQFVFVANLEPRKMMGLQSHGMILCADGKKPIPLKPSRKVPAGTKVK
jgi:methionyl-tRNA synthetase